jgi:hypothetical protein
LRGGGEVEGAFIAKKCCACAVVLELRLMAWEMLRGGGRLTEFLLLQNGAPAQWFWNSDVWLPPNVTWDSFKESKVVQDSILEPTDFARFRKGEHMPNF